jgi:Dyp-type peroxidase family
MADRKMSENCAVPRKDEPRLAIDQIQGNITPGFNKDYQAFLFLKIEGRKEDKFRHWLAELAPRVTSMEQVLAFKSLLTEEARRGQPPKVKTTWINIAFSHPALGKLGAIQDVDFKDEAFTKGLTKDRANRILGDPESNPEKWVVGGPNNEATDIILIVASDDRLDLFNEVARIGKSIYEPPGQSGVKVIFTQYGANLPGRREHFGFRDGISQPGVRGQISGNSGSYLTPRYEDESQGNSGLDLVWPGEFVFGANYPKQHPDNAREAGPPSLDITTAPAWAEDGSFLVFRRLKQNVGAFHTFLHDEAKKLGITPDLFGAKCVGRWASGAPILRAHQKDNVKWAEDDSKNNDFMFTEDRTGEVCPFAAHIRKVYPRGDVKESEVQKHRLLRRGIPYGEPSLSSPTAPVPDTEDANRGLLFLAYQTSIENQFEFLQDQANDPKGTKPDPIIGQHTEQRTRKRQFIVTLGKQKTVTIEKDWVIPTGGGYFFTPSIKTLQMLVETLDIRKAYFSGRPDEARKMLATRKDLVQPKAITPEHWARIWAHAWLDDDPGFKDLLKRNPVEAAKKFLLDDHSLPDFKKFFDLTGDIYKKPFGRGSFSGVSFSGMSSNDLNEIAEKGTLHGKPFCVQPSEWVIVRRKKN